jgi:hypothetical protein
LAVTVLAVMAAGAHALSFSAPALAEQDRLSRETESRVVPNPPTAASDGLPIPILGGAVVLAFAVGIAGGQVHRRRRASHRRIVAAERPAPVATPPARPAPAPPEPETQAEPREITITPPAAAAPAPPPPEVEVEPREVEVAPPAPAAPVPPPPEPQPAPPRFVAPPAAAKPPVPAPPRREAPGTRAPAEPLRLLPRKRPLADDPLAEAPEVPRVERPSGAAPRDADVPLEMAPEALRLPAEEPPAPEAERPAPARRFARPVPWPQEAETLWTCEISWKAGYRKSSFRAMAGPPGPGKRRPIGDSPAVRWTLMGEPEPPTPELAVRVRALVQALEAAGWEHIGRGRVWYAQRFVWRGGGEPQPIDVPDVAEPAER